MTRRNDLTQRENTLNRIEAQKRSLWTEKLHLEAEKTGQPIDKGELRGLLDGILNGEHGAEKQKKFRTELDGNDAPTLARAYQQVELQRGTGAAEAMTAGQELGLKLDPFDAPRLARAIQTQAVAGVHGRQALIRAAGSLGDGSALLETNATEDEVSDAMSNPVPLDGRPETVLEKNRDYSKLDGNEANAEMIRLYGNPNEQRHQASLDRAAAAATPEAKLLSESGAGPPVDPTDYDAMSAEQLDNLLMKESGQTHPLSGRIHSEESYGAQKRRQFETGTD